MFYIFKIVTFFSLLQNLYAMNTSVFSEHGSAHSAEFCELNESFEDPEQTTTVEIDFSGFEEFQDKKSIEVQTNNENNEKIDQETQTELTGINSLVTEPLLEATFGELEDTKESVLDKVLHFLKKVFICCK